jgi:hypothetical protein
MKHGSQQERGIVLGKLMRREVGDHCCTPQRPGGWRATTPAQSNKALVMRLSTHLLHGHEGQKGCALRIIQLPLKRQRQNVALAQLAAEVGLQRLHDVHDKLGRTLCGGRRAQSLHVAKAGASAAHAGVAHVIRLNMYAKRRRINDSRQSPTDTNTEHKRLYKWSLSPHLGKCHAPACK